MGSGLGIGLGHIVGVRLGLIRPGLIVGVRLGDRAQG